MKVYGWTGYRAECARAPNGSQQTREIVATTSWNKAAKAAGRPLSSLRFQGCVTGNDAEIAQAMSKPGTVFWQPLNSLPSDKWYELKEVKK